PDETARKVFVVKSSDNGKTFAPPTVANAESLGVCACCSLKGLAVPNGDVVALYRAARAKAQRDMTLLVSKDGGRTFQADTLHAWNTSTCPMSSAAMLPLSQGLRIAWETRGKIFSTKYGSGWVPAPVEISGENAKHPAMAANGRGETLIAWAVGTGWKRGGSVAWTIIDSAGKASDERGTNDELATWSFPAAYAEANGDFVIVR
ncbi:MAG TPA: hypothetical protein VFD27_07780, partial [Chthoniobacteraceae bacterium]|nr:hypothetical protein [Chthoniobacteraceae bacterium]